MSDTDLELFVSQFQEDTRTRIANFYAEMKREGVLEGDVLDVGEGQLSLEARPDTPSPALPGLELAEFEHQITTALADLVRTCRDDPDEFHSYLFQETVQHKMVKACEVLDEVAE